jgi:hypothetical protein
MVRSLRRMILMAFVGVWKVRLGVLLLQSKLFLLREVDDDVKGYCGMQIFARGQETHESLDALVKTWFCNCE